jgi:hypothetical protein
VPYEIVEALEVDDDGIRGTNKPSLSSASAWVRGSCGQHQRHLGRCVSRSGML